MLKNFVLAVTLAVAGLLAAQPSKADPGPAGPGWYFFSVCAYYGTPASWLCSYGPFAYIGPFTSEASCISTLQLMINTRSPWVTDPYAPSSCFPMY